MEKEKDYFYQTKKNFVTFSVFMVVLSLIIMCILILTSPCNNSTICVPDIIKNYKLWLTLIF